MIESVRLLVTLLCFGYTAYLDYRYREVPNWIWIVCSFSGIVLLLTLTSFHSFGIPYLSLLMPSVFALILWYFGGFGGADAKALITLSLLLPAGFDNSTPFFSFVSFVFACLLSAPYIFYVIIREKNLKQLEIPLLVFLFFGILLSLFVGNWFIHLIRL